MDMLGTNFTGEDDEDEDNLALSSMWTGIAALFAVVAIIMSVYEMSSHLAHYNKPYMQKYVVRILLMVPIYAINSWFAMKFPKIGIYMDVLRECYEAFVIYSFMKYLLNFLNYEMDLDSIVESKPEVKHLFPICFLRPMSGGRKFLHRCKHGILQYTVLRPITTFIALFAQLLGVYSEGNFTPARAYVYVFLINNISQMTAMYSLVMFYNAYKYELAPIKPLPKFLCIKGVVFFSFFQSVILSFLIDFGAITNVISMDRHEKLQLARTLQDFLICIEMMVAAIAHLFAFSHKPYVDLAADNDPCCYSLMRVLDLRDERSDVSDHMRQIYLRIRSTWQRRRGSSGTVTNDECQQLIQMTQRGLSRPKPCEGYEVIA